MARHVEAIATITELRYGRNVSRPMSTKMYFQACNDGQDSR